MNQAEVQIYKNNEIFSEILCDNFPEKNDLFKIADISKIECLLNDLSTKSREIDLYCRWYDPNPKDHNIYNINKINNSKDGEFFLLDNKELYIKNLWIYKFDIGYDFIVIENKPMQTNEVYGKPRDSVATVYANFYNDEYVIEKIEDAEVRERYVKNMLFVISPDKSSMYNADVKGEILSLFTKFRKNNYDLKEDFFDGLVYPNISRNIQNIIIYD